MTSQKWVPNPENIWARGYAAAYKDLGIPEPNEIIAPPGVSVINNNRNKVWARGYRAGLKEAPRPHTKEDKATGIPEGQATEPDADPVADKNEASPEAQAERKRQIDEALQQADEIRDRLEKQWGGKVNSSVRYVREDRER